MLARASRTPSLAVLAAWARIPSANRTIAKVGAQVAHPFRVIKRQFRKVKTRYRSIAKNRAKRLHPVLGATQA